MATSQNIALHVVIASNQKSREERATLSFALFI